MGRPTGRPICLAAVLVLILVLILIAVLVLILVLILIAVLVLILIVIHDDFLRKFVLACYRFTSLPRFSGFILGFEDQAGE